MDIKDVVKKLHPLERKLLPFLKSSWTLKDLIKNSKLEEVEIKRALTWLENKSILSSKETVSQIVNLDKNGVEYSKKGLPEKRFLSALDRDISIPELKRKISLSEEEFTISLGLLKRKSAVLIVNGVIKLTPTGKELLKVGFPEENFISKLPLRLSSLNSEHKSIVNELKTRKNIIKIDEDKDIIINLTDLGKQLLNVKLNSNLIEAVTSDLIKSGNFKNKEFRHYDINMASPKIYGGKRHFVNHVISYIRNIWLELGFKEMTGNHVQTSFWNFDTLFTPQDHPSRELQDTFYIKDPEKGSLPSIKDRVKLVHEKGWKYRWNPEEAKKNLLRAHTTCLSAQTLSSIKKKDLPLKFFSVGKVFRNETLDWSHLFEFYQTEGIVIDKNANLRNLLGYLKLFFKKMGFPEARFRPGPFPYCEPSVEVEVYHPIRKKWVELGGAGIFRPEVVEPLLGEYIPVLAWGLGVERILTDYYQIKDLREIYKNDIKELREIKAWLK
ncbi:MAG TPA: phenylalanine--tRNA ligase subunit alpha [Candidatus Nanoarchaeia archaeon]|nr:phenylalanine--tRNA ligase subunit alpha [Candidatus Nanoarchaeia archaeon]